MNEIFIIAEPNDKRYNITWWSVTLTTIFIPTISLYFNFFDEAPKLFVTITLIGAVGIYVVRYFFNDYKNIGKLFISDKKISIIINENTKILTNIKRLNFHYEGFFGSSTMLGRFPSKDGTGNLLTVTYKNEESETINIYLDDREKKEDIIKMLKIFSDKNRIPLDLGLLVSI